MFYATTVGLGPFRPAVLFDGEVFILDKEFVTEKEAYLRAHEMWESAAKEFRSKLHSNCFERKR